MKLCSTETAFAARIKSYIPYQESRIVEGIPGLFQYTLVSSILLTILSLVGITIFPLEYSEEGGSLMDIKLFSLCGVSDKHSYMKRKKKPLKSECSAK